VAVNANTSYLFAITQGAEGLPWLVIQPSNLDNFVTVQGPVNFANQGVEGSTSTNSNQAGTDTSGNPGTQGSSGQSAPTYP
jgi:hypothetical protein